MPSPTTPSSTVSGSTASASTATSTVQPLAPLEASPEDETDVPKPRDNELLVNDIQELNEDVEILTPSLNDIRGESPEEVISPVIVLEEAASVVLD